MEHYWRKSMIVWMGGLLVWSGTAQAQEWGAPAGEAEPAPDPWAAQEAEPQAAEPAPAQPAEPAPAQPGEWGAAPAQPDPAGPQAELQQLQMQLQQISGQLSQIQEQAFELQEIMDAFAAYEEQLRAKMVALAPDVADDIQAAEALVEELRAVENPGALPPEEAQEFQAKYMEFQQAVQRLQPVEQEASQDPEMQAAQADLETKMMEAMEEIDPQSAQLMDERNALIQRYMALERQLQQPQQPTPQQPETPTLELQGQ